MEAVIRAERLDTLQRIELAEGVNIRMRVAGLPVRMMAFGIDYVVCGCILLAAIVVVSILGIGADSEGIFGLYLLLWFLVRWFYNLPFEIGKRGATPGKRALKIRVVGDSGAPVSIGQSVVRNLLRFVDEMPAFIATVPLVPTYMFGAIAMVCGKRFQRLGDLAAGTIVVYADENVNWSAQAGLTMPPREMSRPVQPVLPRYPLHREEQLALTQFRDRLASWSEGRRVELADHLSPLTHKTGVEGVHEILGLAAWVEESK